MISVTEKKPIPIMLAAILFGIWGILILLGILVVVFFPIPGHEASTLDSIVVAIIGIIVAFVIAYSLWNLKKWAGVVGIILGITGIVISMINGTIISTVIGISMVVLIGIGFKDLR